MARSVKKKQTTYWLPRWFAVMVIAFFSLFSLDVFDQPQWFLVLLIHLIPSFILILITLIAWKNEKVGGWLFISMSVVAAIFFHSLYAALPVAAIGALFLCSKHTL